MTDLEVIRLALDRNAAGTAMVMMLAGLSRTQLEHRAQVGMCRATAVSRARATLGARDVHATSRPSAW